jgi:hypothetical protein
MLLVKADDGLNHRAHHAAGHEDDHADDTGAHVATPPDRSPA